VDTDLSRPSLRGLTPKPRRSWRPGVAPPSLPGHRGRSEHDDPSRVVTRLRRPVQPGDRKTFAQSHRLFCCACCRKQVMLCRSCDRGHRYCDGDCRDVRRRESLRRAGRRYQQTPRGRANHAARQQRYLQRQAAKMTHQTSSTPGLQVREREPAIATSVTGPENPDETDSDPVALPGPRAGRPDPHPDPRCVACGRASRWLRREPLGWRTAYRRHRPAPPG